MERVGATAGSVSASFWHAVAQRDDSSHPEDRIGGFRLVDGFRPARGRRVIESFDSPGRNSSASLRTSRHGRGTDMGTIWARRGYWEPCVLARLIERATVVAPAPSSSGGARKLAISIRSASRPCVVQSARIGACASGLAAGDFARAAEISMETWLGGYGRSVSAVSPAVVARGRSASSFRTPRTG